MGIWLLVSTLVDLFRANPLLIKRILRGDRVVSVHPLLVIIPLLLHLSVFVVHPTTGLLLILCIIQIQNGLYFRQKHDDYRKIFCCC